MAVSLHSSLFHAPYKIHSQILWVLPRKYTLRSDHFSLSLVFSPWSKPLSLLVGQSSKSHTVSESVPRMSPSYCSMLWCALPCHFILRHSEWKLKSHHDSWSLHGLSSHLPSATILTLSAVSPLLALFQPSWLFLGDSQIYHTCPHFKVLAF